MNYKNINLKKTFYVTAVIVVACVIASAVIAPLTTETPKENIDATGNANSAGQMYVLTCEGDRLVAFVKGADKPYIETTTAVSSLPYEIQERLRAGIEFDSEAKLRAVLNEYCS